MTWNGTRKVRDDDGVDGGSPAGDFIDVGGFVPITFRTRYGLSWRTYARFLKTTPPMAG